MAPPVLKAPPRKRVPLKDLAKAKRLPAKPVVTTLDVAAFGSSI
jgi:hypothetical protein